MKKINIPDVWSEPYQDQLQKHCIIAAEKLFREHTPNPDTWEEDRIVIRQKIAEKMGLHYDHSLPLLYKEYGDPIRMDGYIVKKISYLGAPGRYVSGNLYIPDGKGPFPAVINLHGHWQQGRLAERVQSRGHLLAKHGIVTLCVDVFGAGERHWKHGEYSYHGSLNGAALMNLGYPLMGIQVTDNMRGIDLLQSLPFVNPDRIGATGGSGGGNQTMWLAAMDERVKAAVPVVSVGTFESYTHTENCMCELLPNGLNICEESGVLSLIAPRAVRICNALQDSCFSFAVTEMLRSVKAAKPIFAHYGVPQNISYQAFNTPHGYWSEVLQTMTGFMLRELADKGHGDPIPETKFDCLPEKEVMLFEPGERPADFGTIPEFCIQRNTFCQQKLTEAMHIDRNIKVSALKKMLNNDFNPDIRITRNGSEDGWQKITVTDLKTQFVLPLLVRPGKNDSAPFVILAGDRGKQALADSAILENCLKNGTGIAVFDLESTGETGTSAYSAWAPYHIITRQILWHGQPLMGYWVCGYLAVAKAVKQLFGNVDYTLAGRGDAGIAALYAAICGDNGTAEVIMEDTCCTMNPLEMGNPVNGSNAFPTMAIAIPDILNWGDLPFAIATAQEKVNCIALRHADGSKLTDDEVSGFWKKVDALKQLLA
mgnify:CR=1 FL=1